ncbi:amino acid ABC transporter permease [Brachyspira hampsonii]|uniref:Glutamate/aspartate import permease protein GltK n=1 Tax=Brachyspira hampsonii TaxID=1287055 RepID=A0AAC9TVI5_9SPIR|nr:amino acid ABC transporter permease [Brachyspira hampsonii]ASJ22054.1 ABC transporter permease [Brachyspira hampsonii]ELV06495.1 polar amino acid ABC transporter inner membrane subunit [Brachyspira hampsonii 30599]MBW5381100.1 amino acid ABC transporter permease [Brachyspira hampsonii]MBW5410688.1 amino acid ABC transporter permease [Brachyspira hampsonii]OEJ16955.1 ABC transporter permease [Brachyspira hampsonii]
MDYVISTTLYLLKGTYTTLCLYFVTAIISLPLSMLFAALQFSAPKFVRYIFDIYAWIFRGTPLILQLIFFYYGLPLMTNNMIAFPAFTSAAVTFILNYSAYLMEIFRAGIESIEKGQYEAGFALNLSYRQIMTRIILPQAVRRVLPPLSNEAINLIKDTALVIVLGIGDLMLHARQILTRDYKLLPFFIAAIIYLIFTSILVLVFRQLEKKYVIRN